LPASRMKRRRSSADSFNCGRWPASHSHRKLVEFSPNQTEISINPARTGFSQIYAPFSSRLSSRSNRWSKKFRYQAMFAIRVVIRLDRGSDLKIAHSPGHQSACAGDRASAEVISNTKAATHDSVEPFSNRVLATPFQAKLIYTATLAANCYEIVRAESPVEMSRMVELSDWARRSEVVHVTRAIEVNRPYLTRGIIWANANRRAF